MTNDPPMIVVDDTRLNEMAHEVVTRPRNFIWKGYAEINEPGGPVKQMTDQEAHETSLLQMSMAVNAHGYAERLKDKIFLGDEYMENLTPALEAADRVMSRVERDGGLNRDAIADEIARCLIRLPSEERRPISSHEPWRMSISLYREFLIFLRDRKRAIEAKRST